MFIKALAYINKASGLYTPNKQKELYLEQATEIGNDLAKAGLHTDQAMDVLEIRRRTRTLQSHAAV